MSRKYMTYPFPLLRKRRRQVRNVTQDDMSHRRGVCTYMYRKLRRRRRRRPTFETHGIKPTWSKKSFISPFARV